MTDNSLMVQESEFIRGINPKSKIQNPQTPGFIRGVNPKSKIQNPQTPGFIRGVNPKSKIQNPKLNDLFAPGLLNFSKLLYYV
jgi:hypothetical protein